MPWLFSAAGVESTAVSLYSLHIHTAPADPKAFTWIILVTAAEKPALQRLTVTFSLWFSGHGGIWLICVILKIFHPQKRGIIYFKPKWIFKTNFKGSQKIFLFEKQLAFLDALQKNFC